MKCSQDFGDYVKAADWWRDGAMHLVPLLWSSVSFLPGGVGGGTQNHQCAKYSIIMQAPPYAHLEEAGLAV